MLHIASGDLWAGAEAQLFNLIQALIASEDVIIDVILLNHGILEKKLRNLPVNVTIFSEKEHAGLFLLLKILKHVWRTRPDIIHTHRIKENVLGAIASLLHKGVKSVRTVHGPREHRVGFRDPVKLTYAILDYLCGKHIQERIIAVSYPLGEILRKTYNFSGVDIVENGINVDSLENNVAKCDFFDFDPRRKNIGVVARLVPIKRLDIVLDIAGIASRNWPGKFVFYVFGDGPLEKDIKSEIKNRKLEKEVIMMGHKEPISSYLSQLNALLVTSDNEGLPLNVLEALALGIPVVAHNVGGIPDVLDKGNCGFLVSHQDAEQYIEAINSLVENEEETKKKVCHGRMVVRGKYSSERCAKNYLSIYKHLFNN